MKLETIWSIPYMPLTERFRRTFDWSAMKMATKLPANVRYWATITEIRKVHNGDPDALSITLEEVIRALRTNTNRR
jgi:hypothetical protein